METVLFKLDNVNSEMAKKDNEIKKLIKENRINIEKRDEYMMEQLTKIKNMLTTNTKSR